MQAKSHGSPRGDAKIHKGCVAPALSQEVKGHEEEAAHNVDVGVLEHPLKGLGPSPAEVGLANVPGRLRRLHLRSDGHDEAERRPLLRAAARVVEQGTNGRGSKLRACKYIHEAFRLDPGKRHRGSGRRRHRQTYHGAEAERETTYRRDMEMRGLEDARVAIRQGRLLFEHGLALGIVRELRRANLLGHDPANNLQKRKRRGPAYVDCSARVSKGCGGMGCCAGARRPACFHHCTHPARHAC